MLTSGAAIAPLVLVDKLEKPKKIINSFNELITNALKKISLLEATYNDASASDVLAFFTSFLQDPLFINLVKEKITLGLTLNQAIGQVLDSLYLEKELTNQAFDKNQATTIHDLKAFLQGINTHKLDSFKSDVILYFKTLTLSDLDISSPFIKGIIVEELTNESHLNILAKALKIPVVVNTKIRAKNKDLVVISSKDKVVITKPSKKEIKYYLEELKIIEQDKKTRALNLQNKTVLKDNYPINLAVNISSSSDLKDYYNEGIGLVRTEYFFKLKYDLLTQVNGYKEIYKNYPNNLAVIRLFDLSNDKNLTNYIKIKKDNNILNDFNNSLYISQIKAILTSYVELGLESNIKILIPYVNKIDDIDSIKKIIAEVCSSDSRFTQIKDRINLGAMIETTWALDNIDKLAAEVNFFSLGTSDLICSYYNIKRSSINQLKLCPNFFKAIKKISNDVKKVNKEITVCGDLASSYSGIVILIALGFSNFSITPQLVSSLRGFIKNCSLEEINELDLFSDENNLYEKLNTYLKEKGVYE